MKKNLREKYKIIGERGNLVEFSLRINDLCRQFIKESKDNSYKGMFSLSEVKK